VKKRELPAPILARPETPPTPLSEGGQSADNLTQIYNDYIAEHPDLFMVPVEDNASSTSETAVEPAPEAATEPVAEPASVDIIELPASTAGEPEAEPAAEPPPAETAPTE